MTDLDHRERVDNRYDTDASGSFVIGLLTGTVLGAGLGMLFAPKAGNELRNQISEQAGHLANNAQAGYRRATETANGWADKGRGMVDRAREAVSRGVDEASRYTREATEGASGGVPTGSTGSPGTESYGSGSKPDSSV